MIDTPDGVVAIECKSGARWDRRFANGVRKLCNLVDDRPVRMVGVYAGAQPLHQNGVEVWPWKVFLQRLWAGDLVSS